MITYRILQQDALQNLIGIFNIATLTKLRGHVTEVQARIGMLSGEVGDVTDVVRQREITRKPLQKQSMKQVIIGLLTKMTAQATELRQSISVVAEGCKDKS